MRFETLNTAAEVFKALGELDGLEALTGSKRNAILNWRKAGRFPSNTYTLMTEALQALGKSAPDSLWRMKRAGGSP